MSKRVIGNTVYFTYDPSDPPTMTAEEMERLRSMRDEDIDLSDIPEQKMKRGWHPGLYPDRGEAIRRAALQDRLLMLEPEIIEYFKSIDGDPAENMMSVLREYVEARRKTA